MPQGCVDSHLSKIVTVKMAVPSKESNNDEHLMKLVECNMEVNLIEAEVKALEEGLISKEVFDHLMSLKSEVPVAERYTTLLKHVHETLQKRLNISATLDAQVAARVAVDEGLIKKDILAHIVSLNQNVPASLKARYLLQFLQPALQRKLYQFWSHTVKIKYKFTNYKNVWLKLNEYLNGLISEIFLTSLCPEQEDKEICRRSKVLKLLQKEESKLNHYLKTNGEKHSLITSPCVHEGKTILGLQHLSQLHELLVGYSYKWKDIGVALNFQPQDLQTIEATPLLLLGAPKSYLLRLLQDWLQMTLRHTLPPTIENLKKALNSQTVGLGTLGGNLQTIIKFSDIQQSYSSTQVSFDSKKQSFSFYPKCNEIYLREGESTLLEIKFASTKREYSLAYSWVNRGKPCDSDEPILYLHKADIDLDSSNISCTVKVSSVRSSFKVTVPITVHVSCLLDEFTPSLASMYLSRPEVPEDTWPPTGSTKYINLAIIKQQKINYGSEYARLTIRGDIDDVLQDKEPINYAKMYDSLKRERQVMFIEGRPGSGKTTFVHKITRDWASNSSGGIRILLLVSLRVLNTLCNPNLSDILHFFKDLKVTADAIEKRDGKGVCFIFDGLDEFSPSDGKDSIVYKIIDRSYLHQSTVVVASRPAALAEIRNKGNKIIEVIGFTSNQIQEYFNHYPFSDATKPAKLKAYLSLHLNILHMCYLPIHATMVAFLFKVTGRVPRTETEIYALFTQFTLVRSITKTQDIQPYSEDDLLQCLSEEERYNFKQICQLALDKTLLNKQVLHQKEINFFFRATKESDKSLGLITIDRTADLYSFKDVYTFLHLTFQEYLAAYHISTLSDEEQMKLIEEHGHKKHMLVVWKFFCGLVEIKPLQNKFKTLLHKTQGNALYHFQCAYESQQKIVCAQLLKAVHYDIQIANQFLRIPDFTAIGYVTNKAILPAKLLLRNCEVNIAAIDALLSEMESSSNHLLQFLQIEDNALSVEVITKLLANFQGLKSLYLEQQRGSSQRYVKQSIPQPASMNFTLPKNDIQTLTLKGLQGESFEFQILMFILLRQCENLTELNLTHNKIGEVGAKHLSQNLPHCRNLQRINISNNGMSSDEVLNVLHSMKQLKLNIKSSHITNQGGQDIVSNGLILKHLKPYSNLQSLDIVLGVNDVDIFRQSSKGWKDLKELRITAESPQGGVASVVFRSLELYFHNIEILVLKKAIRSHEGSKSMTNGLLQCPNLRVFDISGSRITQEQLKLVLLSLNSSRLEELYLCNSRLDDGKIALLSSHLHSFQSLQRLEVSYNWLSSSGAKALAAKLHHCTKLTKLDLQDNRIYSDAAYAIADGLRLCTNMELLSLTRKNCEQFATAFEQEDKQNRKQIFGCDCINFV